MSLLVGATHALAQEPIACAGEIGGTSAPASFASDPGLRSAIEMLREWILYRMEWVGPPGLSVAVTYRGQLVWTEGFGLSNVREDQPASPRTVYGSASLTKPVTAIAVLQLRDAGRLDLDDPVQRYLPWFEAAENGLVDAGGRPITIRDLLSHSAGIESDGPGYHWSDFGFPDSDTIRSVLAEGERPFPPGTVFKYSNWGFHLLGEIIEAVSGQEFARYVSARVLAPLGMCSSTVEAIPDLSGLAVGYGRALPARTTRPVMPFSDVGALRPAAGLFTTAPDLARFMALVSGDMASNRVALDPASVAEMARLHSTWPDSAGGYGLGLMLPRLPRPLVGHVSRMNGYAAVFFLDPTTGVGVAALGNALDAELPPGGRLSVVDRIFEWMTGPIVSAAESREVDPPFVGFATLAGTFRSLSGDFQVAVYQDSLVVYDPAHPPGAERLTRLVPDGRGWFRASVRGDWVLPAGTRVRFVDPREHSGPTRMVIPGMYADRLEGKRSPGRHD